MMCAKRVLPDSFVTTRPAGAGRIALLCVAGLMVSVAAVLGPSPLMAETMTITADTILAADHVGAIVIGVSSVVLDCAGHKITNPGGDAITLNGRTGVRIKNCVVTNAVNGIVLSSSSGNTLEANTAVGNTAGFRLITSSGNVLRGNTARGNSQFGIRLESFSNGNDIRNNTIDANALGLAVVSCFPNTIVTNNFLDNQAQAAVSGLGEGWHTFDFAAPTGGNYWRDFDSLAEGCYDTTSDGFCDGPKVFPGGQDDLPLTTQVGGAVMTAAIDICHIPPGNPAARHTITIDASAWPAHQAHGDTQGACR